MNTKDTPKMSLYARRDIRDEYDKKINDTLSHARRYVDESDLVFYPNFEENYAKLRALESGLDRREPDDNRKLHKQWQETFGLNTRQYFEGFVSNLQWHNFRKDAALQEMFKTAIFAKVVELRIVEEDMEEPCDVIIQDGTLVLRVALDQFSVDPYRAPRNLQHVLETSGQGGEGNCE